MSEAPFVHLHVHSEFSILDGACRIPALAERAAELEMPAVGLTDHGSLAGAVQLYQHAGKQGVKPIIGCEAYVCDDASKQEKGYAHLTLLAETNEGYGNLIKLASAGYLQGYYYKPRVDWELLQTHSAGLIALSGCLSGRVSKALEESREADAAADLDRLVQVFGRDSTYVEIQNAGLEPQARINPLLARLAEGTGLPLVATGDVHYLRHEDARAHEALLCIQSGDSLKNPNHWKFDTDQFFFKTPNEMAHDFAEYPHALRTSLEIAERCNVEIELGTLRLPQFPVPEGRDAFDYLVELCEKGLQKRYETMTPELQERMKFELKTVREMGFADYFLIVWDFVRFAKQNGIQVGPGRGSAAGSLAAYCLEITDIDPMRYDLLFERFLNPGRKSMPDMDIDFAVAGRDRVINYVAEKYGRDRVAQIITFGTMMARAAVRDAGRVLEVPYGTVDKIAKLIPEGVKVYLDDCLKPGSDLKAAYDGDPQVKEIVDLAKPLEGLVRQDSIHAAGVVIGDRPLTEYVPLQRKGEGEETVTQFGMWDVEALGLLKMDFLGLRNLDVIDKTLDLVGGLDLTTIPLDDKKTYEMLARGEAAGVFQFESSGMREALKQVRPTEFEDLIALVALYRPGPMQYIPLYAKRKNGMEQPTFIDERLRPITEPTYGICLTGDALVFDAASGRRIRIDQLDDHEDIRVQGVDDELSPAHARITAWMDNGVRPVFGLRLRNGTTIKATANHPFLTEDGWRELGQLSPGDYVGTPSALRPVQELRTLNEAERAQMRLLAYLLADGSLSTASPTFISSDESLLRDFGDACSTGFQDLALRTYVRPNGVTQVSVVKDPNADCSYHSPSRLETWLRERGLRWPLRDDRAGGSTRRGPRSADKAVPDEVFESSDEDVARFLAAYWDCDGHVGNRTAWLKTISKTMAIDLQSLLLRLGIRSSIHRSAYEAIESGQVAERWAFQVTPRGTQRFAELIQPFMLTAKREVRTRAADSSRTVDRRHTLDEILSASARQLVPVGAQRLRNGTLSVRAISAQTGLDRQHFTPSNQHRRRIEYACVESATEVLDLPKTTQASRVVWQEIESITPAGHERVYDITVEGIHNFVADNVLVHNCIYQEQYMEIAKRLAGFSPAEADDLRKAIGKKIHELMASLKEKFLEGCAQNGLTPAVANQLWKDTESSQDYSFNKSHSAGYALIAYRTAWLRANHPREYMAALISSVMNTKDRVPIYVNACHEMGIEVQPPDVNESECDFAVVEGKIRFGLNAVKNVGDSAARKIVEARKSGPFVSLWDFTERVDPQVVNKRALEALVKCGAFDATGGSRKGMFDALEQALGSGAARQEALLFGQESMFEVEHPEISGAEYEKNELLRLEKETLGVYVSEHPLQAIREQLRRKTDCGLAEAEKRRDGEVITVGGIVGAIKQLTTKKGEPMVFMRLDDLTGSTEVVVFNSVYGAARDLLELDSVLVVKGRVDHKQEGETKLIALEVAAFEATPERREVRIRVDAAKAPAGLVGSLANVVKEFPGEIPVIVAVATSQGETTLALGPDYRVKPEPDFFAEVKSLLGEAAVV